MHFLEFCLDVVPYLALGIALVLLLRRGLHRNYPFFTSYVIFQLVSFIVVSIVYVHTLSEPQHLSRLYKWVVTSQLLIQAFFEVGVLYELSDRVLLSSMKRLQGLRTLLRWSTATLVLTGSVASAFVARGNLTRVLETFQTLNFGVNLIKIGFLITLILLTRVLHVSWRGLPAGLALGFGISASAEVAASALMSDFTELQNGSVDRVRTAAFLVCVLVWLVYILLPQKKKDSSETGLQMSDLENHMQELQRMVRR